VVPSGGRPRGDPAGDWFVLTCTNCGWVSGQLIAYPQHCPNCGARKKHLVEVEEEEEEDEPW